MDSSSTHQSKLHPHQKPLMMKHFLHAASTASVRFLLAAWVGAAVLFVITSVAEQTSEHFDSLIRDQLATIRFPLYYQFGFACLFGALIACIVSIVTAPTTVRRKWVIVGTTHRNFRWSDGCRLSVDLPPSDGPDFSRRSSTYSRIPISSRLVSIRQSNSHCNCPVCSHHQLPDHEWSAQEYDVTE